jgi:ATP-binding cassette, subfamily B, bacterial PglK
MNYLKKLIVILDQENKNRVLLLIAFSIFVSIVETIGISAIMPFIDIATNFDNIHSNQYYRWLFISFDFEDNVNFAISFGVSLLVFYIFRGAVNLLYSYSVVNFKESLYSQTTRRLFKIYTNMPYQVFTGKNSSYLTKAVVTEASWLSAVIGSVLLMISEIFVIVFIYTLMLFVSWKITLIFTVVLLIKMYFITQTVSRKIKKNGVIRAKSQEKFYEIINRLFGNFEQVKLQDSSRINQSRREFSKIVEEYAKSNTKHGFLNAIPKLLLETVGFSLIILLLIFLLYVSQSSVLHILPVLSLFVLALYRFLPSVNRIIDGYNTLMYYHKSIDIIDEELKTPQENVANKSITFKHKIEIKNVSFSYKKVVALSNINLTIRKGDKIAFIGKSGSGKSTLVNLIIGLYIPDQGGIKVDNIPIDKSNLQNWRSQIGYIPQQVYLFDGTIKENICFGRELDLALLNKVLRQSHIFDFLQTKQGVNTLVGEGGVQLSGGQRQRIAIARALYGQPNILVLDEATSSLDDDTEKSIMNEIYQICKDKTLIVIAHRLGTIKGCNRVYEIKNKLLVCVSTV